MERSTTNQTSGSSKLRLSLDYRLLVVALLIVIAGMLLAWKPWSQAPQASDRTVTVTGQTTLQAEPDEYVFYPTYQFTNADKQAALQELTAKSDGLVKELKALGVADKQIKTDSSGYGDGRLYPYELNDDKTVTYSLQVTVTVSQRQLAQKIQDYLATTAPTGSVSPQANFSEATRKRLESQARDEATKDARAKADQSAKNLGFRVGAVKSVTDGTGFDGYPIPLAGGAETSVDTAEKTQLTVQPGENELTYAVTVVYYVR